MTIAVCVWVSEGVVLAAESRQVYQNPKKNFKIASDNAQKVFQLSSRVGGLTHGLAYVGGKSILSIVEEFKASTEIDLDKATIKSITEAFGNYLNEKYQAEVKANPETAGGQIGLIIAGYDEQGNRQVLECSVPGVSVIEIAKSNDFGMTWRGQTDVISRLVNGFDPRVSRLPWFRPEYLEDLKKLNYSIPLNALTLQDAIDFAVFLIRTTIDTQRFSDGINLDPGDIAGTGGPIDISVMRPYEGFSWVQKKQLKVDAVGNSLSKNNSKTGG